MRFKKPKPIGINAYTRALPNAPRFTVGFPEFWEKAHALHAAFYDEADHLTALLNGVIRPRKPLKGRLPIVLGFMTGIVANSFSALIVLTLNGFGFEAIKIARGMFETSVNAAYLQRNPEEVNDYGDYSWVTQKRTLDYMEQYAPDSFRRLPPNLAQETRQNYEQVLPRFVAKNGKARGSWCKKSLRARAEAVGLGELYPTFYAHASEIHHSDITGLAAQCIENRMQIDVAPSLSGTRDALIMGHQSVIVIVDAVNTVADLGLETKLKTASQAFMKIWRA